MQRSRACAGWLLAVVLAPVLVLHAVVVRAAPPAAPMLGFTPTATSPPPTVATPTRPPSTVRPSCIPVLTKSCDPAVAAPGEEVTCTILVTNVGRAAAVNARIIDHVPEYLDILDVVIDPEDQGTELPRRGQEIVADVGTVGQNYAVKVVIRARVREDAPLSVCVENLAEFRADNCPDRDVATICTLPETGRPSVWWMVVSGTGIVMLVLGLLVARRVQA